MIFLMRIFILVFPRSITTGFPLLARVGAELEQQSVSEVTSIDLTG
ncbi:hypothetical protein P368_03040 [Comamonas thiooxydans]|nr:hypothetical protein P367_24825 [Comamonas thiooxydans]KGG95408.1 hypothetical protein P369_03035 [Comamonas thiooxydans]KGH07977.1 hypothetical protein P365_04040 [Comamonas thiooxydans]KGH15506.1 hypothetical protein P368_03040 [Comamonas thiooxydans]